MLRVLDATNDPTYTTPTSIWNGQLMETNPLGQDQFLAPFFDVNGNGFMSLMNGDYPDYNITGIMIMLLYLEIKLYGGYLMIKEIFIQKQKQSH